MSNDIQRYYTDFMLGKMPIGKAESILRQTPYKHLLDLNIQQNEWSLNKLMQEPDLIRSLSGMYKSETSLTNKRVDSYDTDKIFERGESVTRMVKNISDGVGNFMPKPRFKKGSSTDDNPLIKLTALDLVKYAFIVEGHKFRTRNISRLISNTPLKALS